MGHGTRFQSIFLLSLSVLALPMIAGANLGHRVGAGPTEHHQDLPENSIIALDAAVHGRNGEAPIQLNPKFEYTEFDIRETADKELVLFHDDTLARMLPNAEFNRAAIQAILQDEGVKYRTIKNEPRYEDLSVAHLTLAQLQSLRFSEKFTAGPETGVPTLLHFLERAEEWKLQKPIAAELKDIRTDHAKVRYIEILAAYRDFYVKTAPTIFEATYDLDPSGVSIFGSRNVIPRIFPRRWYSLLSVFGFKHMYRTFSHDAVSTSRLLQE